MIILAIDTSADDTSVAIVKDRRVLSSVTSSQITTHAGWGGIMPIVAKLGHEKKIGIVLEKALFKLRASSYKHTDIDAIAVTQGPGLSIALEVGILKAKELAITWKKPLIAVNHMEGHLYSPFVQNSAGHPDRAIPARFLSLLISGGHTQIIQVEGNGKYTILGETVDDAAGEALDKAARMLGFGYPGGAVIERLAHEVDNKDFFHFPRPMIGQQTLDMSFSGLKTHLMYFLKGEKGVTVDQVAQIREIASSFQEAVFDTIVRKLDKAVTQTGITSLAVGGGVIANKRLRYQLRKLMNKHGGTAVFPSLKYLCGDNAAMIGVAAWKQAERGDYVQDIQNLGREPRKSL